MLADDDESSSSCGSSGDAGDLVYGGGTITPNSHEAFSSNIYEAMDHCASIWQGPTTCLDAQPSATLRYPTNGHYPQQQHLAHLLSNQNNQHNQPQALHHTLGGGVDDATLRHLQYLQQQQHFATLGAVARQQQQQHAAMNANQFYPHHPPTAAEVGQHNTIYHNPYHQQQQLMYNQQQQQQQNGAEMMMLANHHLQHQGQCPLAPGNNNTSRHRPSPTSLATTTTTPTGSGGGGGAANHPSSSSSSSNSGVAQQMQLENHNLMLLQQQPAYLHQSQYSGYNPLDFKPPINGAANNNATLYDGDDNATANNTRRSSRRRRPHSDNSASSTPRYYSSLAGCWARARDTDCYWRASKIFSWKRAFFLLALAVLSLVLILLFLRAVFPHNAQQSDLRFSGAATVQSNKSLLLLNNFGNSPQEDVYSEYPFLLNNGKNRYTPSNDPKPYPRFDAAQDIINNVGKTFVIAPYDWALLRLNNQPRVNTPQQQSILFNVTLIDDAPGVSSARQTRLAFYGRREKPPTHTNYDFVKIITADNAMPPSHDRVEKRSIPARINNNVDDLFASTTRNRITQTKSVSFARRSFTETLQEGVWYFALFNDAGHPQRVNVQLDEADATTAAAGVSGHCPNQCSEHGFCRENGKCECFDGFGGIDCSKPSLTNANSGQCPVLCNNNGRYERGRCACNMGWAGRECDLLAIGSVTAADDVNGIDQPQSYDWTPDKTIRRCAAECDQHGHCSPSGKCVCEPGWFGSACTLRNEDEDDHEIRHHHRRPTNRSETDEHCNRICVRHGTCIGQSGLCLCNKGWNGRLCTFEGCPNNCSNHGECRLGDAPQPVSTAVTLSPLPSTDGTDNNSPLALQQVSAANQQQKQWYCECQTGFTGAGCERPREVCHDGIDNDGDGLVDCNDNDCCAEQFCRSEVRCVATPEPQELLRFGNTAPLPETASFYEMIKFLIGRVQLYVNDQSVFDESRVSVIRGRVVDTDGVGLVAVRVAAFINGREQPAYGITLTRQNGWFDFVVNGGGAVTLGFIKDGYVKAYSTIMAAGWNEFVLAEHDIVLQRDYSAANVRRTTRNATINNACSLSSTTTSFLYSTFSFQPELVSVPDAPKYHLPTKSAQLSSRALIESQILKQVIRLPGADETIPLIHHSHKVEGRETILLIRLLPKSSKAPLPDELVKIELQLNVAGVSTHVSLDPVAGLSYLFAWNGLNAYGQKIYGRTRALVLVSYRFAVESDGENSDCDSMVVIERRGSTELAGYELTLADIGGWNLPVHHRLDIRTGVLYRGDGTKVQLVTDRSGVSHVTEGSSSEEGVAETFVGNGVGNLVPWLGTKTSAENSAGISRASSAPLSSSLHNTRLLGPLALATSADGSVFIGDHNFVRQVSSHAGGQAAQVFTLLELLIEDAVEGYYLAVSPIDGSVFVSLPRRRQIIKLKHLAPSQIDAKNNFIVVAGTSEQCLPHLASLDAQNQLVFCGDSSAAEQAKLIYPKSLAVDQFGNLFFADGTALRMITADSGLMTTVIAPRAVDEKWQPSNWGCSTSSSRRSVTQVSLSWPNALAINPSDSQLYFADETKIFKLSSNRRSIELVAGHDISCGAAAAGRPADDLTWPKSIAFSTNGAMFVLESNFTALSPDLDDRRRVLSWRIVTFGTGTAASRTILKSNNEHASMANVRAMSMTPDDRLLVGDLGSASFESMSASIYQLSSAHPGHRSSSNYFIRSMKNINNAVAVNDRSRGETYVFNQFGQHLETRAFSNYNDQQHQAKYKFSYTSGTRKLESVKDQAGTNLFAVKRNYRDEVEELRVPGHIFEVPKNARRSKLLKKLVERSTELTKSTRPKRENTDEAFFVSIEYDPTGLIHARSDNTGKSYKFDYDTNGRLSRIVYPTGQQTTLTFNSEEPSVIINNAASESSSNAVSVRILPQHESIGISMANDLQEPLYVSSALSGDVANNDAKSSAEISPFSSAVTVAKPNHFSLSLQQQDASHSGTSGQALSFVSNEVKAYWSWHSRRPVTNNYVSSQLNSAASPTPVTSARDLLIHQLQIQSTVALNVAEFVRSNKKCILTADLSVKLLCATKATDLAANSDGFDWSNFEPSSDAQLHTATVLRNAQGRLSELRFGERIKRFTYSDGRLTSVNEASTKSAGRTNNDVLFYYNPSRAGELIRVSYGKLVAGTNYDITRNSAREVEAIQISASKSEEENKIKHHFRQIPLISKRRYVHAIETNTAIQDYDAQDRLVLHAFAGTKRIFLRYDNPWSSTPQQISDTLPVNQASYYTISFKANSPQLPNVLGYNHQGSRDFFERYLEKRSDYAGLVLWSSTNYGGQFCRVNCLPVNVTTTLGNRSPWLRKQAVKIGIRNPVDEEQIYFESETELSYDFNTNTKRIGPFIITRSVRSSNNEQQPTDSVGGVYTTINGHRAVFVYKTNRYGQLASKILTIGDQQVASLTIEHNDGHGGKVERVKLTESTNDEPYTWTVSYDDRNRIVQTQSQSTSRQMLPTTLAYDFAGNVVSVQNTVASRSLAQSNISYAHSSDNAYQVKFVNRTGFALASVVYDADGFVTNIGADVFNWNTAGQLTSATKVVSGQNTINVRYDYDHKGRLAVRSTDSGQLVQFFYTDDQNSQRVTHYYEKHRRRMTVVSYDDMGQVIALDVSTFNLHSQRHLPTPVTYLVFQDTSSPKTLFFSKLTGQKIASTERSVAFGYILTASNDEVLYFPFSSRMEFVDQDTSITFTKEIDKEVLQGRYRYFSSALARFLDIPLRDLRTIDVQMLNPYETVFELGEKLSLEDVFDYKHWLRVFGLEINQLLPSNLLNLRYTSSDVSSSSSLGACVEKVVLRRRRYRSEARRRFFSSLIFKILMTLCCSPLKTSYIK